MAAAYKKSRFGLIEYFSTILREHAESLLLAVVLALLVRVLVLSAFVVRSDAMVPTLLEGEVVLGFRPPFGLELPLVGQLTQGRLPRAGELVVTKCPAGLCLLRVVGIPGDRLEMQRQRLMRNQALCQYTATSEQPEELSEVCPDFKGQIRLDPKWAPESWGPLVVPPGHVFVLNDNRVDAADSRQWGSLKLEALQAQASLIWLSFNWGASNNEDWLRWPRSFHRLN